MKLCYISVSSTHCLHLPTTSRHQVKFSYDSDEESYWEEPAYEPLDDFRARLAALEAGQKVTYHEKYTPKEPSKVISDSDPDLKSSSTKPVTSQTPAARESDYGLVWGKSKSGEIMTSPPPLPPRPPDLLPGHEVISTSSTSLDRTSSNTSIAKDISSSGSDIAATAGVPGTRAPIQSPVYRNPPTDSPPAAARTTTNGVTTVSNFGLVSSSKTSFLDKQHPPHGVVTMPNPHQYPPLARTQSQHISGSANMIHSNKTLQASKSSAELLSSKRERLISSRSKTSLDSNNSGGSGGSSRSSMSGHRRNQLARDFKDSDISSVGRGGGGSSGGSSSGHAAGHSARRRMQTLYL